MQELTTVYLHTKTDVVKAIVRIDQVSVFTGLGFTKEFSKPAHRHAASLEGDKGAGAPGTLRWHTLSINGLRSKDKVLKYVDEVTGRKVPTTGSMASVKKTAIEAIKRWINDRDSADRS